MKKITKILALTLALITLALSCTSCGKIFDSSIFISEDEKEQMAENIENYSTFLNRFRLITDREKTAGQAKARYVKDDEDVKCITQSDKMVVTFILDKWGLASSNDNIPIEEMISLTIPYEIKSAVSVEAVETIISEDKKTVTLIYTSENKKISDRSGQYKINDEITIKYKK